MTSEPKLFSGLASESTHWYSQDGTPAYEITGANGKQRAVTLRDATGATLAREAKGKQIVVFADRTVMFGGKRTGGLRIKRIPGAPRTPGKPAATPDPDDTF